MRLDAHQRYRIHHQTHGTVLATHAQVAGSWWSRTKGLLGRRAFDVNEALIIPHCRSIHTLGMQFSIDAIFVDRAWRVVALRANLCPGRITLPVRGAWGVIELAQGTLARVGLKAGDQLGLVAEGHGSE